MTAEQLLQLPDDGMRHELIRGELTTMPPAGFDHGRVTRKIASPLGDYAEMHRLGEVVVGDTGFTLAHDPDTVRTPDVAFVRAEQLAEVESLRCYFAGAPDLAIEVISPNDRYTEVDQRSPTGWSTARGWCWW
jgi:Uma2 family endonuclease